MPKRVVVGLIVVACLVGCLTGTKQKGDTGKDNQANKLVDASGISIQRRKDYTKLTVINPWQNSADKEFSYYLVERSRQIPEELHGMPIIQVPLQKVICLSTTHIGFLEAIGELQSIVGLSGSQYVSNPTLRTGLKEKRIHDVGYDSGLNYELILSLKPDLVFLYGVGSEVNTQLNKLHDLGITVVLVAEYLERTPLAKAEWIKFFGSFFGKEALADSTFSLLKQNYTRIREGVSQTTQRPGILTGLPFKDTWWMAGGKSNLAVLIEDAGATFLWNENRSREAFPVSLEEVFMRAVKADYWINPGTVVNMEGLLSFDQRFSILPVVKSGQIYNNNLRSTPGGGNDYWESGVVHPDLILADLVKIFHPELSQKSEFYYYRKIDMK